MSEADDVEVVASGLALHQVSQWLGVSAEDVLQQTDAATDDFFEKPRPSLLGLGAKYVSHKSMEQSGLEHKLKQRLKKSADGSNAAAAGYQQAQLDRYMQQRGKRKHGGDEQVRQQALQQHDSSDEEDGGKLSALQQNKKQQQQQQQRQGGGSISQPQHPQPGRKVFDRSQLLAVPVENLSKWQRKRLRQKEKAATAAQQQ